MKNLIKNIRPMLLTALSAALILAFPIAAFANEAPQEGSYGGTLQIEYRFAEGETPDIPDTIEQYGFTYHLVSKSPPVLESTMPEVRTYTYNVSGALTQEQLNTIRGLGNVKLTPVNIVYERVVDKEININMDTNDVDDVPKFMTFTVTSGTDPSGQEKKQLERVGVTFERAGVEAAGAGTGQPYLPGGYIATVVYRGIETYTDVGYYTAEATFQTNETEDDIAVYVVVADYETEGILPPVDEEVIQEPVEPTESADEAAEDIFNNMIARQSGNPFIDIMDGNVPLGGTAVAGVWSFLSMILSIAAVVIAGLYALGALARRRRVNTLEELGVYDAERLAMMKKRGNLLRILTILVGAVTLLTWIMLDNFSLGMVWINNHTITVAVLFAFTVGLCVFTSVRNRKILDDAIDDGEISETEFTA